MADSFEALVSLPKFSVHSSPPFDNVHPEHFLGLAHLPGQPTTTWRHRR